MATERLPRPRDPIALANALVAHYGDQGGDAVQQ